MYRAATSATSPAQVTTFAMTAALPDAKPANTPVTSIAR
jgi:hypothetical protein